MIQKISSRHISGPLWRHTVNFATVLFGFEEFMRELYAAKKVELIDGETLETSHDFDQIVGVSDTVNAGTDQNRQTQVVGVAEESFSDLNVTIDYVLGPYFPSSFADTQREFILDGGLLG